MQTRQYVTHKQMHAKSSRHNQLRLYNIDLNDIKISMQSVFMCQGVLNSNQPQE